MDLDTNVKNFKYSPIAKAICLFLCLVTLLSSVWLCMNLAISYEYFNEDDTDNTISDFTESHFFTNYLYRDVYHASEMVKEQEQSEKVRKKLSNEKVRTKAVDAVYGNFIETVKTYVNDFGYLYDSDDNYIAYRIDEEHTFSVDAVEIIEYFDLYDCTYEYIETISESIYNYIEDKYDNYVDNESSNDEMYWSDLGSLCLYIKYKDYDTASVYYPAPTKAEIKSHDYYYILENGKADYSGLSSKTVESLNSWCKGETVYMYFSFPEQSKNENIIARTIFYVENYDKYFSVASYFDTAKNYSENFNRYLVLAIISIVLTFTFGFIYLSAVGKKNRYDKSKPAFIDYLPIELHLLASGLLVFGASVAFLGMSVSSTISFFTLYSVIYTIAVWLVLIEILSSLLRSFRSERKWYKFFLVYWLFKGIGLLFKLMARLNKQVRAKGKKFIETMLVKPNSFKRNVILLAIGYVAINILLIFLTSLSVACEFFFIGIFLLILILCFNGIVLFHTIKYISQLDRIITASRKHKEFDEDLNTLYISLRYLAESMKYTNAELQNAVAKAVKDERLRTELITNVSHDLKTPLTSIINYVDLLSKCDIQDEKARDYIKVLDDKGAKLKRLIDDLIEASKVTSGNVSVNLAPLSLAELCLQATVDAQEDFDKAGLSLVVKESERLNMIIADGPKTFRIIENLLSNARKYSAPNSRVYISTYDEDGFGVFEIKNVSAQPLDISADELTERFVRGDKSRTKEGNGLGLSIAKELTRLQNGKLEIIIDGDLFKVKVKLPLNK